MCGSASSSFSGRGARNPTILRRDAGIAVLTTVHSLEDARAFHAMGVDFIEANDAGMLVMSVEEIAKALSVAV